MNQEATLEALRLTITGRVQGVGFRPFVYRLAHRLEIRGWVCNVAGEVEIAAEGLPAALADFQKGLIECAPPLAQPQLARRVSVAGVGFEEFAILDSHEGGPKNIHVPPDQFACDDCLAEMTTVGQKRYRYPFINCTQCGPRYTIINALPYDRPNTAMAGFPLCPTCHTEYTNPLDRRFHAQPLACPECGPAIHYVRGGKSIAKDEDALSRCVADLKYGAIVAVRGIGGYHLVCNAADEDVVQRLRERKHRPSKPLAVMVPWTGDDGFNEVRKISKATDTQLEQLADPARPVMLVLKRPDAPLAPSVAPGLDEVGIMLPYSPLHHLLLEAFGAPVIATSGNISGEPVITEAEEAERRLAGIADGFLQHNRPILRPADDPVMREIAGVPRPVRLGRGNAPLEMRLPFEVERPTLAVGAFLKNTVAFAWNDRVVVSPHIGDLGSMRSRVVFEQVVADLQSLYGVEAEHLVSDAHPDYPNTRWARDSGLAVTRVYHHHAHASALAGELGINRPMLVFTWDGLGLGEDGTLWGGEALLGQPGSWRRTASYRPFRLPGGDRVVFEPWRTALALIWECDLDWQLRLPSLNLLKASWERGINSPLSSAVGRLFDAAAVYAGILHEASYDGEAPALLEAASLDEAPDNLTLPVSRDTDGIWRTDWSPLVDWLISSNAPPAKMASTFHACLARSLCVQAELVCAEHDVRDIGLAGGVFQNRRLTDAVTRQLADNGFDVHVPARLPVNDAAVSFGQIIEVAARGSRQ